MTVEIFYKKMEKIEASGNIVGYKTGKLFKNSYNYISFYASFFFIGCIVFFHSVINGIKKS